jgi:hypothetical protein
MSLNKVIELCEASVGYTEGPNNDTTFGKWFGLNNQPWCAMSASKMYFDAGMIGTVANTKKALLPAMRGSNTSLRTIRLCRLDRPSAAT